MSGTRKSLLLVLVLGVAILAVGCTGNGASQAPGGFPPVSPSGDHAQFVIVTDFGAGCAGSTTTSEVLSFNLGASTNLSIPAAPADTLNGSNTGLDSPYEVYIDPNSNEWVANFGGPSVTEYPVNKSGNAAPSKTLAGSNTTFVSPLGVAVSQNASGVNDWVYVADYNASAIDVFSYGAMSGSSNNIAPSYVIKGATTALSGPSIITLDSSGNIWVANANNDDVLEFSNPTSGAPGTYDVAPIETIGGGSTTITNRTLGVYVDHNKNIWVGVQGTTNGEIAEFAASSGAGAVTSAPLLTISGSNTQIGPTGPYGIAVDNGGDVYVASGSAYPAIHIWSPSRLMAGPNDVAPTYSFGGGSTKLACPLGLQVFSNGNDV